MQTLTQMNAVVVDTPNTSKKRPVATSTENTPSPVKKDGKFDIDSYIVSHFPNAEDENKDLT